MPKSIRLKGFGSRVLVEVERLAKEWRYAKVLLRPKPLIRVGPAKGLSVGTRVEATGRPILSDPMYGPRCCNKVDASRRVVRLEV